MQILPHPPRHCPAPSTYETGLLRRRWQDACKQLKIPRLLLIVVTAICPARRHARATTELAIDLDIKACTSFSAQLVRWNLTGKKVARVDLH